MSREENSNEERVTPKPKKTTLLKKRTAVPSVPDIEVANQEKVKTNPKIKLKKPLKTIKSTSDKDKESSNVKKEATTTDLRVLQDNHKKNIVHQNNNKNRYNSSDSRNQGHSQRNDVNSSRNSQYKSQSSHNRDGQRQQGGSQRGRDQGGFDKAVDRRGIPIHHGSASSSNKSTRSKNVSSLVGVTNEKDGSAKRSFKATRKKQFVNKRKQFVEKELSFNKKKSQPVIMTNPVPKLIEIMESISIVDLAKKMNLKASTLLSKLMSMGMMANQNSVIDYETAQLLASEYECEIRVISLYDQTLIESPEEHEKDIKVRPPIVTIMGHVDHGKTTLLDTIRKSNIASAEQGNITQHIGAYMVHTNQGDITFLDTPGHEAFTLMRSRGAKVTDIIVLVVAADDGLMPQTIEAISHAKVAKVPILVAINKMDSSSANLDRILQQMAEQELVAEEWGGDVPVCRISAIKNEGIDDLLEHIILQAEVMGIKSSNTIPASGVVLESRIEHGKGVVATILIQKGILKKGDNFLSGVYSGKVRDIFDDRKKSISHATSSMPVEVIGLDGMPESGDPFQVTANDKVAKLISTKRQELLRYKEGEGVKKVTADNLYESIEEENTNTLKVIIKGDVHGSVEAIKESLEKINHDEIKVKAIHASAGTINAADILLASASDALVIGFHVRPTQQVQKLANQEKVEIQRYTVIFDVIDSIKKQVEGMLSPEYKEEKIGQAEVRDVFSVPKFGVIAGAFMHDGKVEKDSIVSVQRNGKEIHKGKVSSLKRFKDDVNKVEKGFECGIGVEGTDDIQIEDILVIYREVSIARTL